MNRLLVINNIPELVPATDSSLSFAVTRRLPVEAMSSFDPPSRYRLVTICALTALAIRRHREQTAAQRLFLCQLSNRCAAVANRCLW